jgi:hypothetical protein
MKPQDDIYRQAGIAAFLPGFQYAVELMQSQLDQMRAQLNGLQNEDAPRRGRPKNPKVPPRGTEAYRAYDRERQRQKRKQPPVASGELNARGTPLKQGYWATLTAEQRSVEMKKRQRVAHARKNEHLHITDPRNPNHQAWLESLSAARKKDWEKLTPAQRKERLAKLAAGRAAKKGKAA